MEKEMIKMIPNIIDIHNEKDYVEHSKKHWSVWNKCKKLLYKNECHTFIYHFTFGAGSSVETFATEQDTDVMHEYKHLLAVEDDSICKNTQGKHELRMVPSEEYPGYVKLRMPHEDIKITGKVTLKKDICGEFVPADAIKQPDEYVVLNEKSNSASNVHERLGFNTKMDIVTCIKVHVWPKQAMSWETRKRPCNKLNSNVVEEVVKNGCHLVCKQPPQLKDSKPYHYFRLSFSCAERKLIWTWDSVQHTVYQLLKAIQNQLGVADIIKTYYIKTIMLREYERKPDSFWSGSIAQIVTKIWTKILQRVKKGCLPHYFLDSCNILDGVHICVEELDHRIKNERIVWEMPKELLTFDAEQQLWETVENSISQSVNADVILKYCDKNIEYRRNPSHMKDIISHKIKLLHDCIGDTVTDTIAHVDLINAVARHTYSDLYGHLHTSAHGTKLIQEALEHYRKYMECAKASSAYVVTCYIDCLHKNGKLDEVIDFLEKPKINFVEKFQNNALHKLYALYATGPKIYKMDEYCNFVVHKMSELKPCLDFMIPCYVYVLFLRVRFKETMEACYSSITDLVTDEEIKLTGSVLYEVVLLDKELHVPFYLCLLLYLKSVHKYGYLDLDLFGDCIDKFSSELRKLMPNKIRIHN